MTDIQKLAQTVEFQAKEIEDMKGIYPKLDRLTEKLGDLVTEMAVSNKSNESLKKISESNSTRVSAIEIEMAENRDAMRSLKSIRNKIILWTAGSGFAAGGIGYILSLTLTK